MIFSSHSIAPSVDLRSMFGERYRSPRIRALRASGLTTVAPHGRGSHVSRALPAGSSHLPGAGGCWRSRRPGVADWGISRVWVAQDGGDEAIVTFDVMDLETVAAVLGAKRRRRLSDEHRAKLTPAGAKTRFSTPETTIAPEAEQCVA